MTFTKAGVLADVKRILTKAVSAEVKKFDVRLETEKSQAMLTYASIYVPGYEIQIWRKGTDDE